MSSEPDVDSLAIERLTTAETLFEPPRRPSTSGPHSSPPSIYPVPDAPAETLTPPRWPPRPSTSASNRPIHTRQAYVVLGSTQSCVAILPVPRAGSQLTASGRPLPATSNSAPAATNSESNIDTTRSAPPSIFPSVRPLTRRRSETSLTPEAQFAANMEKYLRNTVTIEEHRREVELEIIKRNREREREKESVWGRMLGKVKRTMTTDEWDGAQVVYMTAKEAAEREWEIRNRIKHKAVGLRTV